MDRARSVIVHVILLFCVDCLPDRGSRCAADVPWSGSVPVATCAITCLHLSDGLHVKLEAFYFMLVYRGGGARKWTEMGRRVKLLPLYDVSAAPAFPCRRQPRRGEAAVHASVDGKHGGDKAPLESVETPSGYTLRPDTHLTNSHTSHFPATNCPDSTNHVFRPHPQLERSVLLDPARGERLQAQGLLSKGWILRQGLRCAYLRVCTCAFRLLTALRSASRRSAIPRPMP